MKTLATIASFVGFVIVGIFLVIFGFITLITGVWSWAVAMISIGLGLLYLAFNPRTHPSE